MSTSLPTGITMVAGSTNMAGLIENLITETESPGGLKQCTWDMCGRNGVELGDLVVIHDSLLGKYPFVGRLYQMKKSGGGSGAGGNNYSCTVKRSTQDRTYKHNTVPMNPSHPSGITSSKIWTPGSTFLQAIYDALTLTPDVNDGGITSPGLQFVADSNDLGGQTAEQVWNYRGSMINSSALITPYLWHVRTSASGLQVVVMDFADFAPRYFVYLPEEQIESEEFDLEQMANEAAVSYGNTQIVVSPAIGQPVDYTNMQIIRTRYVSADNTLVLLGDAQAFADAQVARLNMFRSVNDSLRLTCDANPVRCVPPVSGTAPNDNWPLWLVEAGRGIHLKDRPVDEGPLRHNNYNPRDKFITSTQYNWDEGVLVVGCGTLLSFSTGVNRTVDYNVNRLFNGPYTGPPGGNHPLSDADLLPKVGPEIDQVSLPAGPSFSYGIPAMTTSDGGQQSTVTKYGKVVNPDIVADEGLEINYTFDCTEVGWKGGTYSIPGILTKVKYSLWNAGSPNGLIADSLTFDIYTRAQGALPVALAGGHVVIAASREGTITIGNAVLPGRESQLVFKVTTAASSTGAQIINISLHGKKHYPGLKT